ncbi:prolyl aminopeptidase [Phytomonospora endophytica]|uniref:Proline iminopeptidase n=1 Tax=Phytomonospora endophytica TaxID=714109 RepID=A0A841FRT0_9ACTN|nr:prolyl aminopeptidase [Phytomonospora endophytica]MBB6038955.1 proline iminopeptidase [Phytomonospora endophytica]GIG67941.1 proline iminopeptidase [Phytomonospora endophytica]
MATRYPPIEPHASGMLDVGDGNRVHWETCGNPDGKPAVVLHGGPGSGASPNWRRYFDPERYRIVVFDQRGCGRSTPDAGVADLSANTTAHLIADIEALRHHLGVERWLVLGASWGATLGVAYTEAHPESVSEVVLFSVTTTTRREVDWITGDMRRVFPAEWTRLRDGVPESMRGMRIIDAYAELLDDPDPAVRDKAARDWCAWEDTHVATVPGYEPDPRYADPVFRLRFARLVTHYWRHSAWYADGELLAGAAKLGGIPAVLIHGRLDFSSPLDIAHDLAEAWPGAELVVVDDAGHGAYPGTIDSVVRATDGFAAAGEA